MTTTVSRPVAESEATRKAALARAASRRMSAVSTDQKNDALRRIADAIEAETPRILAVNGPEIERGRANGLTGSFIDRMELTEARLKAIANDTRAVAALRVAEANVTAARAQLAQSQTQRARAIIRSPVNGVVLARQVDPGQTVAASFNTPTLFVIAEDLSKMKLEVAIDEADVGQVKTGQRATFAVDAFPGRTFPATISRVDLGSNLTVSNATASSSSTSGATSTTGQVVSYAADLTVENPTLQLRDRKSTRLNSSHVSESRMPSSA